MSRLLQINVASNRGSTGRIVELISNLALGAGWDCYVAHGVRYASKTNAKDISIGNLGSEMIHGLYSYLFDRHGLGSVSATKKFSQIIKQIKPDIVHIHNLHGYYINYRILFNSLKALDVPIVWTLHDCWPFTGHCAYFKGGICDEWENGCQLCPSRSKYPGALLSFSEKNYALKKEIFTSISSDKLLIAPVSRWLAQLVEKSFLGSYDVEVIHNGVDIDKFKPLHFERNQKKILLGVAYQFSERKGLVDFIKLASLFPDNYQLILVGVDKKDISSLPGNITGVHRTENQEELVRYYSMADVFINPTYEDNFPTTNIEALACGTPIITYRTGGSPEAIDGDTGRVVERGDIAGVLNAIREFDEMDRYDIQLKCRRRAEKLFDQKKCFMKYLDIYNRYC